MVSMLQTISPGSDGKEDQNKPHVNLMKFVHREHDLHFGFLLVRQGLDHRLHLFLLKFCVILTEELRIVPTRMDPGRLGHLTIC